MYEKYVKDADILLFKAPSFPKIGWFIATLSFSKYSHVGIAKIELGELYCIEFREFKRSRKYKVSDYLKEGAEIDVFRISPSVKQLEFDPDTDTVRVKKYIFDQNVVNHILYHAEDMIGRKYSWSAIKDMVFTLLPFIRMFRSSNIGEKNGKNHVCSTFVSYLIRRYYVDPCQFLPDSYTKPGDLARSNIINYLFTLD